MRKILAQEVETYTSAWSLPKYKDHSPGERYLPLFLDMSQATRGQTVLDAGAGNGKGTAALTMAGFLVTPCDFVRPDSFDLTMPFVQVCLWDDLIPIARNVGHPGRTTFDWVYCTDVLEHIPTALTMLVVSRLLQVARFGVFLSISMTPDQFGVWVGKPLHQTVESFIWWRDHLAAVGKVVEARDLLNAGVFLVKAR